jgi:hypothetical protein
MKYKFIEDPGHGWLEVQVSEIYRLGIGDQISRYSYVNNGCAYLEEDCDFAVFMEAKKYMGEPVELASVYQENTPIRNYESWGVIICSMFT